MTVIFIIWLTYLSHRTLALISRLHYMTAIKICALKILLIGLFMYLKEAALPLFVCGNNVHIAAKCLRNSISSLAVSTRRRHSELLLTCS